jgi:hypothetical protein
LVSACLCRACEQRAYLRERRDDAIDMLGGVCEQCGDPDTAVLQINHKVPVLRRDRGRDTHSGSALVASILTGRARMSELEILCANCHMRDTTEFHRRRSCARHSRKVS